RAAAVAGGGDGRGDGGLAVGGVGIRRRQGRAGGRLGDGLPARECAAAAVEVGVGGVVGDDAVRAARDGERADRERGLAGGVERDAGAARGGGTVDDEGDRAGRDGA